MPLIQGLVQAIDTYYKGQPLQIVLISRRARKRAGTRYTARGCDEHGNVANFVETESIITTDEVVGSWVVE